MHNRSEIRLLAIDPGSVNLGYAHMIGDRVLLNGSQKFWGNVPKTRYTLYYFTRMNLEGLPHDSGIRLIPKYLVLESYFPQRQHGAVVIPELRGIIKLAADQLHIEIVEVAPGTIKKRITGNGRASKDEVRRAINELYGLSIKDTDEADAIAIGITGLDKICKNLEESSVEV